MNPVFDTRATADVLIAVAKRDPTVAARYPVADYRTLLMAHFPGGAAAFTAALARGVTAGAVPAPPAGARRSAPAGAAPTLRPAREGEYYLLLYPSPVLGDGRGANKPWLQELPDPVTKIAWQSWVEMHPSRTKRLGLEEGDVVTVRTPGGGGWGEA
jgi:molybdopterin-containing oxidoreductase family iron-sulfur binding subunit